MRHTQQKSCGRATKKKAFHFDFLQEQESRPSVGSELDAGFGFLVRILLVCSVYCSIPERLTCQDPFSFLSTFVVYNIKQDKKGRFLGSDLVTLIINGELLCRPF